MPLNGMTSASGALRYWERRQEVTANNLANISTDGFKAERAFSTLMNGAPVIGTATDRRLGTMRAGGAMDVALGTDSFLVVQTDAGERFTRGGHLHADAAGFLADADGHRLLGAKGAIQVGSASPDIDAHGGVSLKGTLVDHLRVESAPRTAGLQHEGGLLLVPGTTRTAIPPEQRDVRQGFVEESNADSFGGLVDMIGVQRAYAAVEKSITVLDHIRETATSQLGRGAT
ncbi:flagellar basal-body rod protein FlgG [soil metagenome]